MQDTWICNAATRREPASGHSEVATIVRLLTLQRRELVFMPVPPGMQLHLHLVMIDIGDKKIETLPLPFLFRLMFDQDAIFIVDIGSKFTRRYKLVNPCSGTS